VGRHLAVIDDRADAFGAVTVGLGFAQALGERGAGAIDVGARAGMTAIQKEHAAPDLDRALELTGEIPIETGKQQLLDALVARRGRLRVTRRFAMRCVSGRHRATGARATVCARGRLWDVLRPGARPQIGVGSGAAD
jgi:hypothetical protein